MISMPRSAIIVTTYSRRPASTWCRLAVSISGLRVRIVVWHPVAWKNDPYSRATLDPPMITHRFGS